ncbi:MAG: ABC transporter permease [Chitinophagaceae bacterium]
MLKNYLKVAFRNLWKNKFFSAINMLGLAIGISTCLLITLFVLDELSFDHYNENAGRIYRVNTDLKFGGAEQKFAVASAPLGFTMVNESPEIENAVRFRSYGSSVIRKGDQNIKEDRIIYADSTLFDVFTLPIVSGHSKKALTEPNTLVISERIARKYFNRTNVAGEILLFDNKTNYKITAVIRNIPPASHFNFDIFVSLSGLAESRDDNWLSFNFNTYLLLRKNVDPAFVESRFQQLIKKYTWPKVKQLMNITPEEFLKSGNYFNLSLMPLTAIHLHSDRIAELAPNGDIKMVYIFSAVAIFILLIACVNFMNLSTARSANRAKEVGIRKVLGTPRYKLIYQFLTESVLMSLFSFLIAIVICTLALPFFNELSYKELSLSPDQHPFLLVKLIACAIVIGLLAGSYPALYLSAFEPIVVLKGKLSTGFKSSVFRNSLVIFQFFISTLLIIGTIVIYRQLNYIQHKKLGFSKEQVIVVKDSYVLKDQVETFKNEVLKQPALVSATVSGYLPVPSGRSDSPFFPEGEIDNNKAVSMQYWSIDHDYINTMGMEIAQGRDFSKQFPTDSAGVIINESAAGLFSYTAPVGKKISVITDVNTGKTKSYTILSVVKNFHFESLRQNIGALCLVLEPSNYAVSFRVKGGDMQKTVGEIERLWKKIAPGEMFNYSFLNEDFNAMYRSEQRMGSIAISFAFLAIFIACLGLFGLANYAAEQRTREIGIRKVLGASVANISAMLSKDFLKLVVIATIITFPIAWFIMHQWLQDFAYRTNISWWIFTIAGLIAITIALLTISFQAVKAALSNPVKSLRTE